MSIQRGTFDIDLYYADDDVRRLTFTTEDDQGSTVPFDLTVYDEIVMEAKLRQSYEEAPLVTWTLGDGLTVKGADDNVLELDLSWSRIEPLKGAVTYPYDLRFMQGETVSTFVQGTITVTESVTTRP